MLNANGWSWLLIYGSRIKGNLTWALQIAQVIAVATILFLITCIERAIKHEGLALYFWVIFYIVSITCWIYLSLFLANVSQKRADNA